MAITAKEAEEKYGLSEYKLDEWEKAYSDGEVLGKAKSPVIMGRPLKFGEATRVITFKEPLSMIEAIDARAAELGMPRSDYIRSLIDQDLRNTN